MTPISPRIAEATRAIIRVARHYARDILIAVVLAVAAAILIERYEKWTRLQAILNNRKAIAILDAYDQNGRAIGEGTGFFINKKGMLATAFHVIKGAVGKTARCTKSAAKKMTRHIAGTYEACGCSNSMERPSRR